MNLKKVFLLKSLCLSLSLVVLLPTAPTVKAAVNSDNVIPNQQSISKPMLNKYDKINNSIGTTEFWSSLKPEEAEKYYVNEDLTVSFKENVKFNSKESEKEWENKRMNFEKNLKAYYKNVESANKKLGKKTPKPTDGKGGLAIGSVVGDGSGTNSLSVSGLVRGDLLLLNDGGNQIQGAIMHAGMYDGTTVDVCIYSAGPDGGVRWESVSDWRKNDEAWKMYVKGTTTSQRSNAFDTMKGVAKHGEPYVWNSSKTNTDEWYCSKMPWYGYKNGVAKKDIDFDGGFWVLPIDIYNDNDTALIQYYK